MIEYTITPLQDFLDECEPMLADHYEEVAMYTDKIDLDPDYTRYEQAEEADLLRIFTLKDDGKIVGYNIFFVGAGLHYSSTKYALNDIVYIDPDHRHQEHTVTFFKRCESWLKEEGVQVISYHMKANKTFTGLMEFLEFDHAEHVYTKYVG